MAVTGLGGSLTITGVSAAQTGLTSLVFSGVASGATNVALTVQGVGFTGPSELPAGTPARVVNNVFANLQVGASMTGQSNVRLFNNLFVADQTAIVLDDGDLSQIGENALWQNIANYGGTPPPARA